MCGLLVDYCDAFIICVDSHSDGTHSWMARAHFQHLQFWLKYPLSVHKNHKQKRLGTGITHKEIQKFIKKEHGIKILSHKYTDRCITLSIKVNLLMQL